MRSIKLVCFYPEWKSKYYPYRFIWSVPLRQNERSIHGISESWRRLVAMHRYHTETDTTNSRLCVVPLCTIPPCCFSYVFCQSISTQDSILKRRLWCKIIKLIRVIHSWNLSRNPLSVRIEKRMFFTVLIRIVRSISTHKIMQNI